MVPLPTDHSDVIDLLSDAFREINFQSTLGLSSVMWGYTGTNPVTGKSVLVLLICVMTNVQWAVLKADKTSPAVLRTPPLLAVEVVSPGSKRQTMKPKVRV